LPVSTNLINTELIQNPGAGIDEFEPFKFVEKDGYSKT
jgi:hypothetical protein